LNGTTDYEKFDLQGYEFLDPEFSAIIPFWPGFATNEDANFYLFDTDASSRHLMVKLNNASNNVIQLRIGGTIIASIPSATYSPYWAVGERNLIAISGTSAATNAWLISSLGVGQILTNDTTVWAPGRPIELYTGAQNNGANKFRGKIGHIQFFKARLTEQEAIDYYNDDVYTYREKAVVDLPMLAAQHEPNHTNGIELFADNDMEAAGDVSNWPIGNAAVVTKEPGQRTGGTGSLVLKVAYGGVANPYARQVRTTVGKSYSITGWVRSDGTAIPWVLDAGSLLWAGTASTNWQYFSVIYTATGADPRLVSNIAVSGYTEWDDCSLKETEARTLDVSPYGNNAQLGDGSTVSTYPTKLTKRGYHFDRASSQYMTIPSDDVKFEGPTDDFTIAFTFRTASDLAEHILDLRDANDDGWQLIKSSGTLFFSLDTVDVQSDAGLFNGLTRTCIIPVNRSGLTQFIIDGRPSGSAVDTSGITMDISMANLYVGRQSYTATSFYEGDLFDLIIEPFAFSRIQALDLHKKMMMRINQV
jgi:hypothetical protein